MSLQPIFLSLCEWAGAMPHSSTSSNAFASARWRDRDQPSPFWCG
jgi:hypothetical protein